ncbi:MAG TPA: alanyl-tRNA editing protein [Candidatus Thermoplasmatota archaeon]|nr:alanyl-tRNA editing protein [Candidatus Thermoplasmatota archaeon]
MTELLYFRDPALQYAREFRARVTKALDDWVRLDVTAFHPEGGGQPSDVGELRWAGGSARVKYVSQKGVVKHVLEGDRPPEGAEVTGLIDWENRYALMRMHTSQHVVSGLAHHLFGARTVGNQVGRDHSRVDLHPVKLSNEDLSTLEAAANEAFRQGIPIRVYDEVRRALEEKLGPRVQWDRLPMAVQKLRVIEIGDVDLCPCAGTHVENTREIGRIRVLRKEGKGKETERIVYAFDDGAA